jgi:large subunit ribosomal protein L25
MSLELDAIVRTQFGSAHSRRIRRDGLIPGVVYGPNRDTTSVELNYVDFAKAFMEVRQHKPLTLKIAGKPTKVLVRSYEQNPVTKKPFHVDFYEVAEDASVKANIPLALKGTSPGVRRGGIMEFFVTHLKIQCLPKDLMEEIAVDISKLDVNDAIYVRDMTLPEGISLISKDSQCIVRITSSRATKMAEAADRD